MVSDKERLDWLDSNSFTAYRHRGPDPKKNDLESAVVVDEDDKTGRRGCVGKSIRAAIDQAIDNQRRRVGN